MITLNHYKEYKGGFDTEERSAIEHIFTVVSSLDSVVLGETQITGQFKNSTKIAKEANTLGPTLTRLSQEALAVTKKIRSQTAIGEKTVSISHAAIDLAKTVFVDLSKHKFLIIGAGEMAELAVKYSNKYNPKNYDCQSHSFKCPKISRTNRTRVRLIILVNCQIYLKKLIL